MIKTLSDAYKRVTEKCAQPTETYVRQVSNDKKELENVMIN